MSSFWKALLNSLKISQGLSTAYHPQTDGQAERVNQVLEDYLRHFISYHQDNWDRILDIAEFCVNNLENQSTKVSPFFFMTSFHPHFSLISSTSKYKGVVNFITEIDDIQQEALSCLNQAKLQQARYCNKKKRPSTQYAQGDEVLILKKFIASKRFNNKLDYRLIGPFKVIRMIGKNAVELDISKDYPHIHPVFSVSLIVKYFNPTKIRKDHVKGVKDGYYSGRLIVDWEKVDQILDIRIIKNNREFLIRWKNTSVGEDTWVKEQDIPIHKHAYLRHFCNKFEKYKLG